MVFAVASGTVFLVGRMLCLADIRILSTFVAFRDVVAGTVIMSVLRAL